MSYLHMFYGVDLASLRGMYGSGNDKFVTETLKTVQDELEENDELFEDEIEEGEFPNSETALREIVAGKISHADAPAVYGYVLKIICERIGKPIGDDVAAVRDHPYESQLLSSGPPIDIPYDPADFPEIGFLSHAELAAEIDRIDAAPKPGDEDIAEDVAAYRSTLIAAKQKGVSLVSFRH